MVDTVTRRRHKAAKVQEDKNRNKSQIPPWLKVMYGTVFFDECETHPSQKKDRFCTECLSPVCSCCLPQAHASHKSFKIRRYLYSEVINRQDLCKHFNCSGIQSYSTNKAKVLFLKRRDQTQHQPPSSSNNNYKCKVCERSLPDPTTYCSIACKVLATKGKIIEETSVGKYRRLENDEETLEDRIKEEEAEEEKDITTSNLRKFKRKGVPRRAPFF